MILLHWLWARMLCKLLLIHVERDIEWLAAGGVVQRLNG
jgi:hypothetical protein